MQLYAHSCTVKITCCAFSGLGNSIWMAYAGIVGQGVDVEPMSYAG